MSLGRNGRARTTAALSRVDDGCSLDTLHEWVLDLPWVVERPTGFGSLGIRMFAVDCEPLDRRQIWLLTGARPRALLGDSGIAVILPLEVAATIEAAGRGRCSALLPARHALVTAGNTASGRRPDVTALVRGAYSYAVS